MGSAWGGEALREPRRGCGRLYEPLKARVGSRALGDDEMERSGVDGLEERKGGGFLW